MKGYSIMEIMLSLFLIAIVMAVGYPVYTDHVIKQRRVQAEEFLLHLSDKLIQFHAFTGYYSVSDLHQVKIQDTHNNPHYEFQFLEVTHHHFTLAAIPQGTQKKDTQCQNLTLNSLGQKGITGKGNAQSCWQNS